MNEPEKFSLLDALTSDRRTAQAVDQLWLAAQMWLACGGTIPMNRYLRLPATKKQLEIAGRDLWLLRAARLLPDGNRPLAVALHGELEAFVSRGPWKSWESQSAAPDNASELRKALFKAMKFSGGRVLDERQIYRILASK